MRAALDCGSLMAPLCRCGRIIRCPTLQQLLDGLGDPGAAACVVRDGEITDEAVTGTLDGARPWATDTLVMTYSCAKPFAALTVLTAVADGALDLDRPVADLWPAYAADGKQATTVRHVLAHQAGLPAFPEPAIHVAFDERDALVQLLAEATPIHEPGAACAEHALTYGHLCDQLVRLATGRGPRGPVRRDRRPARMGSASPRRRSRPRQGGRPGCGGARLAGSATPTTRAGGRP